VDFDRSRPSGYRGWEERKALSGLVGAHRNAKQRLRQTHWISINQLFGAVDGQDPRSDAALVVKKSGTSRYTPRSHSISVCGRKSPRRPSDSITFSPGFMRQCAREYTVIFTCKEGTTGIRSFKSPKLVLFFAVQSRRPCDAINLLGKRTNHWCSRISLEPSVRTSDDFLAPTPFSPGPTGVWTRFGIPQTSKTGWRG